jgi:aspartate aminotransferase
MYGYGPTIVDVQQYADAADRDVVRMVSGRPDWEPPAPLRTGLRDAADGDAESFQYAPPRGIRPLREALAASHGPGADPAAVTVTSGTVEANHLAMARALERGVGETVLVPDPGYPYYAARVRMLGGRVRRVPVGSDGSLDADGLRERADDDLALVVVNTPNNPTGAVYDRETLTAAVAVAEEHDAYLLSDEVYGRIDRSGEFASALSVDSDRRIVTGSVSKSLAATGLRVGYGAFPERLREATTMRHVLTTISASRPAQEATLRAVRECSDGYHREVRDRLDRRAETFVEAVETVGADYVDPVGSMYVFARLPGVPGTLSNVRHLVDEGGVAAMPGGAFGEAYEEWIRFSLTTPRVETAAERLVEFVRSA